MAIEVLELPDLEVKKCVQNWGSSSSEMILDLACQFFSVEGIEGGIGYHLFKGVAVIFGDPICPQEDRDKLATLFYLKCQEQKLHVICMCVSSSFALWAKKHLFKIAIEVGEELSFNPMSLHCLEGHKGYRLRNRTRHAEKMGIYCEEYVGDDLKIEAAMSEVAKRWLKARKGLQIHLGPLQFFEERLGRRWFFLNFKGEIIGAAMLCALNDRKGWLLKFLMTNPDAPRGSSELLMISILKILGKEECRYVTYGTVARDAIGETTGLGKLTIKFLNSLYFFIAWAFELSKKKSYWEKFRPMREPVYVLFSHQLGWKEMLALAKSIKIERAK